MKFAILPGSLRDASYNKNLGRTIAALLRKNGHETDFLDLREFPIPLYDGDLEEKSGIPAGVSALDSRIRACNALVICTPEYNGSIPGVMKNVIDWLSRIEGHVFKDRPTLLTAASPGALGGVRSLNTTRQPLETLGAYLYPEVFGLAKAHETLNTEGGFKDKKTEERVEKLLSAFIEYTKKLA